jgi:hypothetical protein
MMCFLPGFCDCGWAAFVILLLTALGVLLSVVALVLGALRKGWTAAGVAIAVVCLGLFDGAMGVGGMLHGRSNVEQAVSVASSLGMDPSRKQLIMEQGYSEARSCVTVGAQSGALLVVLGLAESGWDWG